MADESMAKPRLVNEYLRLRQRVGELEEFSEEARRDLEFLGKFRVLFSEISDLVYIFDTGGNILYVNEAFERLTGHKPKEYLGRPFESLFDGENLKKASEMHGRTLKDESTEFELAFKDTGKICEYKNIPMRDDSGRVTGILGIAREVTVNKWLNEEIRRYNSFLETLAKERTSELITANERLLKEMKEREWALKALKDSEEKYQMALEAANDAVYVADAESGCIIYVNRKGEELIGRGRSEIIGMHHTKLHPEEDSGFYGLLFGERLEDLEVTKKDIFVLHSDGRTIPVEISSSIFKVQGKKVVHGFFRDLTEIKKATLEIERLRAAAEGSGKAPTPLPRLRIF